MSKNPFLLSLFFSLLLFACGNNPQSESTDGQQDMSEFAEDEEFKNKHKEPEQVAFEGKGEMMEFNVPNGEKGSAYIVKSNQATNKFLFVIHEWWGLNNHIKMEAERLYDSLENVTVLALDLYDGKVADNRDDAGKYMQEANNNTDRINAIINGALGLAGSGAEVATVGWCFGGGWSLKAAMLAGEQGTGCVIYYGMPITEPSNLGPLKADVLGIFASQDQWITPEVAQQFKDAAETANKDVEIRIFDADHAFANPSGDNYDPEAAKEANALALQFLREHI